MDQNDQEHGRKKFCWSFSLILGESVDCVVTLKRHYINTCNE